MSTLTHKNGIGGLAALLAAFAGGTVETLALNAIPGTAAVEDYLHRTFLENPVRKETLLVVR